MLSKGEYKMKKKVLSLLAAATLCMGLMVVPFHASAATPIRDDINGISCYASVSTSSTYASALTQFGSTADYISTEVTFHYGYGSYDYRVSGDNDGTGTNAVSAYAYKNGSHTYIQILGASGNHYIRYGNLFFNPPGGTSTGTP